jgi:DNA-binding transcriptional ArsR family regulator
MKEISLQSSAALDRSLRALADGNRRAILGSIRGRARPVGEVADDVGLSQQVTSHHFRVLRTAGLVSETRVGTRHLFAVNSDGFSATRSYLEEFWPARLEALRVAVETRTEADDG